MLLIAIETGCLLSLTQMTDVAGGFVYFGVSAFLALTAIFYAAIFEDRYDRMELMFKAWTAAAVITSMLGILGYFHAFPARRYLPATIARWAPSRIRTCSDHTWWPLPYTSSTAF